MTEVDAVMPEGAVPTPTTTANSNDTATEHTTTATAAPVATSNNGQKLKDQQNGINKETTVAEAPQTAMEVDGVDTEEDDSQITSSTENGDGVDGGKFSKAMPSTESSKESLEANATRQKSLATNEDSSNACEDVSSNGDGSAEKPDDDSRDSAPSIVKSTDDGGAADDDSRLSNGGKSKLPTDSEGETTLSRDSGKKKKAADVDEVPMDTEANDTNSNSSSAMEAEEEEDALAGAENDPLPIDGPVVQKENGVTSEKLRSAAADSADGIVDLGDDSDDDEEEDVEDDDDDDEVIEATVPNKEHVGEDSSNIAVAAAAANDSDGAVVIGSDDSDNEATAATKTVGTPTTSKLKATLTKPNVTATTTTTTAAAAAAAAETQIIDDDDDDCVVIEDDTPLPVASDLSKRKSIALDASINSDDSQPPSKRQRSGIPMNQITIKDARSLMPQQQESPKRQTDAAAAGVGVYPINITPAPSVSGPPKLVPMANAALLPLSATGVGAGVGAGVLPGISQNNANLLPGLTDDMFVLEAPSFIVPYIYEKPPTDNLREIVKDIEAKYNLSREDLAEADKSDEFDMMTEQNKSDEKSSKKKKKRGRDADDSWSEESDEDDDDDDDDDESSEADGMRTKVLIKEANDDLTALKGAIKPASIVAQSSVVPANSATAASPSVANAKPGLENYFESPLGKFFMDIGVGLVQEFVQSDLIRLQKRKMRKSLGKNITEFERAIAALSGNIEASQKKNSPFKFTNKRCEFCNFKSESALAMANHYETPHMNGPLYKCNFCVFEIRNATEIVYHMEAVHNIKARLIKPLPYHVCPNCGFEDNGKAKLARHQPVCAKKFRPDLNLAPPSDWEAPAKIPRIKPRHGLVGTATAYQAMAAQAAAQKAALASIQQQQAQVAQARSLQAAAIAAQNAANKIRGRQPVVPPKGPNGGAVMRGPNQVRNPMATNVVLPNNYQLAGGQLLQTANALAKKTLSGQPSISITPLPRQSATPQATTSPSTSKMPPAGMKPGQSPSGSKAQFVICEICDGYIKDLEQLRNHMQWMHKVKIHPKMIYNRPPLNCQKCQFRFFTDQGLERHLLGSHGLVTSSMQEAANKGKDAGRCPVCGRMYQWKLLNHVSRDHHMTLKPAHLSYKCTVCTATFGMYKQFETHVYTAHSTVAKKAMDGKKNNAPTGGAGASSSGSSSGQRISLGASNDSLLKPLKINDEITIIPQPSSKPRITNMESHVID